MEKSVDLSKGQIKYLSSEIDVKQDFYLKCFEHFGELLLGVQNIVDTTSSLYNNLPSTQKSKTKEPDFDSANKSLTQLLELHGKCAKELKALKKEKKALTPAVKLTLSELQQQHAQKLLELEAQERQKLEANN